jgi:hypothetical protein
MLISIGVETEFAKIWGKIPDQTQTLIVNSSIKLTGSGGSFTGSGVILYESGGTTTIATAKHLLYSFAGKDEPPTGNLELVTAPFQDTSAQKGVRILYGDYQVLEKDGKQAKDKDGKLIRKPLAFNQIPASVAPITKIIPIDGPKSELWEYDVMILESNDEDLAAFAKKNAVYTDNDSWWAVTKHLTTEAQYLATKGTTFVRTGFGVTSLKAVRRTKDKRGKTIADKITMPEKPGTNKGGGLQYVGAVPEGKATLLVWDLAPKAKGGVAKAVQAIWLKADEDRSSGPGDSGGPLFAYAEINKVQRLVVIGLTNGANFGKTEKLSDIPAADAPIENNIATSLAHYYAGKYFDPFGS